MSAATTRYSATIVRKTDGNIDIRVTRGEPALPVAGDLVEVLYGYDEQELMARAMKFAQERVS